MYSNYIYHQYYQNFITGDIKSYLQIYNIFLFLDKTAGKDQNHQGQDYLQRVVSTQALCIW